MPTLLPAAFVPGPLTRECAVIHRRTNTKKRLQRTSWHLSFIDNAARWQHYITLNRLPGQMNKTHNLKIKFLAGRYANFLKVFLEPSTCRPIISSSKNNVSNKGEMSYQFSSKDCIRNVKKTFVPSFDQPYNLITPVPKQHLFGIVFSVWFWYILPGCAKIKRR